MDHLGLAESEGTEIPDWDSLFSNLVSLPSGRDSANRYEKAIEPLLSALFYPSLSNPQLQRRIHNGRKRVDLSYTNAATQGFFHWVGQHYSAPHVFVECKNYEGDPGNPELDQLSGRFSPSRGQLGILVCRRIEDKTFFLARCRDTANDLRGFVIPVDDEDLRRLVEEAKNNEAITPLVLLRERFESLVM